MVLEKNASAPPVDTANEHTLMDAIRLSLTHLGAWDWDPRTLKFETTPEWDTIYGVASGTVKHYQDWIKLVHRDDRERIEAIRLGAIQAKGPYHFEFRIISHPTGERWLEARGAALYDETGNVSRVFGVTTDITERKANESLLRERSKTAVLAIRASQGGAWRIDIDNTNPDAIPDAAYMDSTLKSFIGYQDSEFPNSTSAWHARIHPDDILLIAEKVAAYRRGETERYQVDYRIKHKDGHWVWIHSCGQLFHDEQGVPKRWLGIDWDITNQRQLEENLREAKLVADTNSSSKSAFLANMSHEIRTPLNAIIGMSQLLKHTALDGSQAELVDSITNAGTQLLGIITDILDFSKIEAGKLAIRSSGFSLSTLVAKIHRLIQQRFDDKSIEFSIAIDPLIPDTLIGDELRLGQILTNLLSNAAKFTPKDGSVSLQMFTALESSPAEADAVTVTFYVVDNGIGIPAERIDELFQPFNQIENQTSRSYEGTGLGLVITKNLIELMGGSIEVESKETQGSVFMLEIPFRTSDADAATSAKITEQVSAASLAIKPIKILTVLLAEDNIVNQRLVSKILERRGHTVIVAQNGREVLQRLSNNTVDAILMDCHMPEMDGFECTREIRRHSDTRIHKLPVIALTANAMVGAREKCIESGMDEYISKPVDINRLIHIVEDFGNR